MEKKSCDDEDKIDQLEQYDRRQNLEFEGLTCQKDEDVSQLVIDVAEKIGVKLQKADILVAHRLPTKPGKEKNGPNTGTVIARFVKREVRNEIYYKQYTYSKTFTMTYTTIARKESTLMKFSRRNEKDFFGWQNKRLRLYNTSSFGQIMGTFLCAKTYTLRRYRLKMEMIAVTATFLLRYVILVILFLFSQKIYLDIICLLRIVVFVRKFGYPLFIT